eukprot:12907562-Ditylum_brightwellii.AAC.1
MAAPDREEFRVTIVTEVNGHINNNHWELIPISQVPKDAKILDSVWAFKRKRDICTRQRWLSKQIDFVMAYTQAPPDFDMLMRLPHDIECTISGKEHVIKLLAYLYGSKQGT